MKFTSGDGINAPPSANLPAAAPNEKVQVSMDLTAPTADGMYASCFGEILAIGTPQEALAQWQMDDHWGYVPGSGFNRIGVGYAYNSCSDYGGYITVDSGE